MGTDYPDYATPQAHANAIAGTGAPLLTLSSGMLDTGNVTIAAGASATVLNGFPITQLGYDVNLNLQEQVAGTAGPLQVEMDWIDALTGLRTAREHWNILPGTPGNAHQVVGTGPTKGDKLTVVVTNNDTVAITYRLIILQNSRLYPVDFWRTDALPGFSGFNVVDADVPSGLVAWLSQAVAATGGTYQAVMPLFAGQVHLHFESSSSSNDAEVQIFPQILHPNVAVYDEYTAPSPSGNLDDFLILPRTQCRVVVTNHGSALQTLRVWMVAA